MLSMPFDSFRYMISSYDFLDLRPFYEDRKFNDFCYFYFFLVFPFSPKLPIVTCLPWVSNYFPPPRGFREVCWTRPPVYEIPSRENFCWTGQTAGGGE